MKTETICICGYGKEPQEKSQGIDRKVQYTSQHRRTLENEIDFNVVLNVILCDSISFSMTTMSSDHSLLMRNLLMWSEYKIAYLNGQAYLLENSISTAGFMT